MLATQNYMKHLTDSNFKSVERGRLDTQIHVQHNNLGDFRLDLVPSGKMVNIIPPTGAPGKIRYSNMGDFGAKTAGFINNWKAQ